MPNPLGDKTGCNVFLFCLPAYLLPSYYTCCFFTRALYGVTGWWGWFLYAMRVREKWELWRQKGDSRHYGRWKSMRKSRTLSRRGQRNRTQIHSKSACSGSLWNNLFKYQSISGGCHLCALLECQPWLISTPMDHVFTFSSVVKASGKKAAYPVRVCNNAGGLVVNYWMLFHR